MKSLQTGTPREGAWHGKSKQERRANTAFVRITSAVCFPVAGRTIPDQVDEIGYAVERDLAIRNVDRESSCVI